MKEQHKKEYISFINFDTYEVVKRLCASGMPEGQAGEVVHAILSSKEYDISKISTKEQVASIEKEMEKFSTKEQFADLEKRLEKFATKEEWLELKMELKVEMHTISKELIKEISKSKSETIKWVVGLFIAMVITIFIRPCLQL